MDSLSHVAGTGASRILEHRHAWPAESGDRPGWCVPLGDWADVLRLKKSQFSIRRHAVTGRGSTRPLVADQGAGPTWVCLGGPRRGARSSHAAGKKTQAQTNPERWTFWKLARSAVFWFTRGLRVLGRRLQMKLPWPPFYPICPVMWGADRW